MVRKASNGSKDETKNKQEGSVEFSWLTLEV